MDQIKKYDPINNEENLTPIQKFYDETNILITGSTGFLGKLLVEKLLRSCPTINCLYLLIREKKEQTIEKRLEEMFEDVVFNRLKKENPDFKDKIIGIAGDCSYPDLGINLDDRSLLINKINIVFHNAATVRFNEKLSAVTKLNIRSLRDLIKLAEEMLNLKSFMHVSTIFANCLNSRIEEKIYPTKMNPNKLINLVENLTEPEDEKILDVIQPTIIGKYPNTYAFSKQAAEYFVKETAGNLPIGIFRPAIVVATFKEPVEGWINNIYGPTGIAAGIGLGFLRVIYIKKKVNANIVPADMCVNSMIISAKEVGEDYQKSLMKQTRFEPPVYNYGSTNEQPINWGQFQEISHKNFAIRSIKCIWYPFVKYYEYYYLSLIVAFFLQTIPAFVVDFALLCMGKKPRLLKTYRKIGKFIKATQFFCTHGWKLQTDRIRLQQEKLNKKDHELFFSDLTKLNWYEFCRTYTIGIILYVLKESMETAEEAQKKYMRLFYIHTILITILLIFFSSISLYLIKIFILL